MAISDKGKLNKQRAKHGDAEDDDDDDDDDYNDEDDGIDCDEELMVMG